MPKLFRHRSFVFIVILIASTSTVLAQSRGRDPHLAYAYPAGCERGMTCEIVVGGQYLKDVDEVYLSGKGVSVEIVKWYRPLTNGEYNNLRTKFRDARERLIQEGTNRGRLTDSDIALAAGITADQLLEMEIYRKRESDPKRQPNDQLEEQVTLQLSVAMDAELGKRELRFVTETAMSNPIWIHLDRWIEHRESEPNEIVPAEVVGRLPVVINGQIMPGDVDRFKFHASKGTRLVIQAAARDVIPYLADAVPGWFQAVMRVMDATGEEVSFADSFHYRQDPVLYFEVPRDGSYTVEIRDALYRGREDFVYRITIGEIPFVTSVFPLGARVDSKLKVQLRGWNLTHTEQDVETPPRKDYRPVRSYTALQGKGLNVRFPLQIDHWPEIVDQEPNNEQAYAQEITTRMTINGRIDEPGDQDVYLIKGGGRLVAEIHARRFGSPIDSMLTLTDEDGNEIAFNDDHDDKTQAMLTHHADSHLSASVPGNRNHYLTVSDAQRNGGPEFTYRLRMRAPQPDYELRVTPSSIIARAGRVVPITVFALREDGYDEDINLKLVDPPPGFRIDGGVIPGEADRVRMTLTVPDTPPTEPIVLNMEGAARRRIRSQSMLTHPAIPAENMMQAFIWYHLVPVENWNVVVSGKPGAKMPLQVVMPAPRITLPRAGDFRLKVLPLVKDISADQLHVQLTEPPAGISAALVSNSQGAIAIQLSIAAEEVEPGLRGNLLISVYKEFTPEVTETDLSPRTRRTDYGFLPAIPFEVSERKSRR